MITPEAPAPAFLLGGGQTGALMRSNDWSGSPLGRPESWPQSLRSIVNLLLNSQFPMFVAWGPELGFLYNDAYAEILGAKHPAAMGRRFQDVWSEIWDNIYPSIEQAMHGNATYHENLPLVMDRKGYDEQTWFTFSYSPVRDESGEVMGMFCAVTETTDQVLAERHRVEELARLRRLFQQAPGLIAVLSGPQHIYEIANDAYLRLVGREELVGTPIRQALPELKDQGFFELLDQVYRTGVPHFGHETGVRLRRHSGGSLEERFVNFVFQPTFDHRGKVVGIFIEGSDVTEAVKAHRALKESETQLRAANREKDEFLAMLAHELRNPLAPIAAAADLLRLAPDHVSVQRTSGIIARQVQHMAKLVDDLLDVSRVTRGLITLSQETVNIGDVLADAVEQVRSLMAAKRQHFTTQIPGERILVQGDRTRLVQVFANIFNNASKYTPEGGHIALRVHANDARVEVVIQDDGIGISQALLPRVFDAFTQADRSPDRAQGGLGLGLVLVKKLLELHRGEISAHSAGVGAGSRFTVQLPRLMEAIDSTGERDQSAPAVAPVSKARVLIVDDNEDAAHLLGQLLQSAGHETYIVHNAEDALSVAQQKSPTVAFLDIGLPVTDGYELARRLRALPATRHSMLVAITGYGGSGDKKRAEESGFDHHLVKPASFDKVLRLLDDERFRIGSS